MLTRAPADVAAAVAGFEATARRGRGLAINAVQFLAQAGRVDRAFALVESLLFDRGEPLAQSRYSAEQSQFTALNRETWFLWTPLSAPLRADPRMLPILTELGLVDYWRRTGS